MTGSGLTCKIRPSGAGSAFMRPGRKNEAGDTVVPELIPEQPAASNPRPAASASRMIFPFIRTWLI